MHEQTGETEEVNDSLHIETDLTKLEPLIKPTMAGHQWIQMGPDLVCKSCPLRHGIRIGTDKRLMGIDQEGLPILVRVREE